MDTYPAHDPIGSSDRRCPVDVETLRAELHAEASSHRDSWREADVQERVTTLGLPCEDSKLW